MNMLTRSKLKGKAGSRQHITPARKKPSVLKSPMEKSVTAVMVIASTKVVPLRKSNATIARKAAISRGLVGKGVKGRPQ